MKKRNVYVLVCTIFVGGVLASCNKDNFIVEEIKHSNDFNLILEKTIIDFRQSMVGSEELKSGLSITAKDAIDQMEGSFNYFYGFPDEPFSKTEVISFKIGFNYEKESLIREDDLRLIYKEINNTIYDIFTNCRYIEKRVKLVDIESVNYKDSLSVIVCIGEVNSKKTAIWLGETPFNLQQNSTWLLGEPIWLLSSPHYNTCTQVANALNNAITIPFEGSNEYIYVVQNTGWLNSPVDYQSIYIPNPSIAAPNEESSNYFSLSGYVDDGTNLWHYYHFTSNGMVEHSGTVDYRFMNKYYNISCYAIEKNRPSNKEAILFEFASSIYDYFYEGRFCRWLDGVIRVTYASKYPRGVLPDPDTEPGNPMPL